MRDKFRGALMGTFVGDAVGVPVEGFRHDQLSDILDAVSRMPQGALDRAEAEALLGLIASPAYFPGDTANYSDDTQMMHGVAESLIEFGHFHGADMAEWFVQNFDLWRGYGAGAYAVLMAPGRYGVGRSGRDAV